MTCLTSAQQCVCVCPIPTCVRLGGFHLVVRKDKRCSCLDDSFGHFFHHLVGAWHWPGLHSGCVLLLFPEIQRQHVGIISFGKVFYFYFSLWQKGFFKKKTKMEIRTRRDSGNFQLSEESSQSPSEFATGSKKEEATNNAFLSGLGWI